MSPESAPPAAARPNSPAEAHARQHLAVSGLSVERGPRRVLADLSFELRRGEVLGILGRNGAGKTTLFHVLCGLCAPSAGSIVLDGCPIRPGARELRSACGVVFQSPALDPRLGARQNLALAAALHGVPRSEIRRRAAAWLERVGLAERAEEPVSRLSGGMRRRVEIVRALMHDPALLVLDEPTTGLDEAAFRRVWDDLLELRERRGLSLLLTTHRAEEAERCDRVAILHDGRFVADDTPARLRSAVRGDLLVLDAQDPAASAALLRECFGQTPRLVDGRLTLRLPRAHELVPRVVECLPPGELRSIGVRRTGLAEVFLELTGHELDR